MLGLHNPQGMIDVANKWAAHEGISPAQWAQNAADQIRESHRLLTIDGKTEAADMADEIGDAWQVIADHLANN